MECVLSMLSEDVKSGGEEMGCVNDGEDDGYSDGDGLECWE